MLVFNKIYSENVFLLFDFFFFFLNHIIRLYFFLHYKFDDFDDLLYTLLLYDKCHKAVEQ